MNNFKVGDVVSIKDGSYSVDLNNGGSLGIIGRTGEKFTILAFGHFSTNNINHHKIDGEIIENDTLVISSIGKLWFCNSMICFTKDLSVIINSEVKDIRGFLCVSSANSKYKNKAFYLSKDLNWSIQKDNGELFLIPTRKE